MRRTLLALPLALVAVITYPTPVGAQDTKMTQGTVTAMVGDSITIKATDGEMKFSVDLSTRVVARGAGTRAGRAAAAGQAGPKLSEVIKVGQAVEVSYTGMSGAMHATQIRAIAAVAAGGAGAKEQTTSGTVSSVSVTSINISGDAGGGATFTQTFAIDSNTKVIGRGAGTAAAAAGGRTAITDLVGNGDRVSISFRAMGDLMHASEVRVTMKAAK